MKDPLVLVVTGDRNGVRDSLVSEAMAGYATAYDLRAVYEGCADGVDTQVWDWARGEHVSGRVRHNPAPWAHLHKPAGQIRNGTMLGHARREAAALNAQIRVAAFHEHWEESRGTRGMVEQARKAGVPVDTYGFVG